MGFIRLSRSENHIISDGHQPTEQITNYLVYWYLILLLVLSQTLKSQDQQPVINEFTPSKAIYFSWINHAWEGTDEVQTMTNLNFFKWLYDNYGMKLDLYLLDAGTLDEGPECIGKLFDEQRYGSFDAKRFKQKFPKGLNPISEMAKSFDCSLGMWLGPDGYGSTPAEAGQRSEMLVSLCRDNGVDLFKFDACCSDLAENNQQIFIQTMKECRKYSPDLIVLNHRISFNNEAKKQTTTWLWEGKETYVDVHFPGSTTGTHHRTGTLSRGMVPQLQRLTEDHGVCLSSCLDFWEDDLVLQAFNRSLILAPEIYGNPWLLNDDEFAKLARIYNLHHLYNPILVNGLVLPPEIYRESAVSRGDSHTRLITLRNLTWLPETIQVKLDTSIGLSAEAMVEVRQVHPVERILGKFKPGSEVTVEVLPFRTCLLIVSDQSFPETGVEGIDYELVKNIPDHPVEIDLLGFPGTGHNITLSAGTSKFTKASLDGEPVNELLSGNSINIQFIGDSLTLDFHRKLADAKPVVLPDDAEALYEATCFSADNNALEVRSLMRSGPTRIPSVQLARDGFFERNAFIEKGIWDRNLFDGDTATCFKVTGPFTNRQDKVFRIDMGRPVSIDSLVLRKSTLTSILMAEGSPDLSEWETIRVEQHGNDIKLLFLPEQKPIRYIRIKNSPASVAEIEGYRNGSTMNSVGWRASNLFASFAGQGFSEASTASFTLPEIAKRSYLAIALPGKYEPESVYAALRINGKPTGAPDRAVSYPANTWEAPVFDDIQGNYTYFIPLQTNMAGIPMEVVVIGNESRITRLEAEVWITAYPAPYERKKLILE